ncbi:MAG: sporulation protein Cse60 [Bacilli bacterium]|nr:sporulation protein Cse60 [Bacilli bacterium]
MAIKVKIFDEEHEKDLEESLNGFLEKIDEKDLIDIKFQISNFYDNREQIYCYAAMVIYRDKKKEDDK